MSHDKIEKNIGLMGVLVALVVSVGGLVQIVPLMFQAQVVEPLPGVVPYPALQLAATLMKPFAMDTLVDTVQSVLRPPAPLAAGFVGWNF